MSSTNPRQHPQAAAKVATSSSPTGRHPVFRGIRSRGEKWVSEIRVPRKTTRIWLGTFATAEMAAAAYDAAAISLRGNDVVLNFPESVQIYRPPASSSPEDVRSAAAAAAAMMEERKKVAEAESEAEEYVDFEELFDMPNLMMEMAGGMMISPPRMGPTPTPEEDDDYHSPGNLYNLWSYQM